MKYSKAVNYSRFIYQPNAFEDSLALLSSGKLNVEALMSHELDYKTVDDFVNGKLGVVSKAVVKVGGEEA